MSSEEKEKKKAHELTAAAKAKDPQARAIQLLAETKDNRKKTAFAMVAEGYSVTEIETAFKAATTKGIGPHKWKQWKLEGDEAKRLGEEAGPIAAKTEKAFESEVLTRFKNVTKNTQLQIIDLGTFIFENVVPQVPAGSPGDKIRNAKAWVDAAITAFQPEELEEIEKFGAAAFLAALEVKRQMRVFMAWAEPSKRLENLAEKALYSPNPLNMQAFEMLLNELMKTIHAVPRFERGPKLEEVPGIIKAYASARGISPELAERRMQTVIKEVT